MDIQNLSDDALYDKLEQFGLPHGPIVSSTRSLYEKLLVKCMGQEDSDQLEESDQEDETDGSDTNEEDCYVQHVQHEFQESRIEREHLIRSNMNEQMDDKPRGSFLQQTVISVTVVLAAALIFAIWTLD